MSRTVLAIAHRGGNSLSALHAANLLPADIVECDVHHHRGRLEVRHLKTAGPLPFLWDRWELRAASAPRLALHELLLADERGTRFMLDLKTRRAHAPRAVAQLLHDLGHEREVLVCGRWWPAVDRVASLPFVRPVLSARTGRELSRLRVRLESSPRDPGDHLRRLGAPQPARRRGGRVAAPPRRAGDDLAGQRHAVARRRARRGGERRHQRRAVGPGRPDRPEVDLRVGQRPITTAGAIGHASLLPGALVPFRGPRTARD